MATPHASDAGDPGAGSASRPWALVVTCVLAGAVVLARSWTHLRFEHLDFDSDQAVIGLMAKHFGEGRAVALYQYAFDYVLVLNAWVAAPLVRLFGASVAVLRVPELLGNVAVACLVVLALVREVRLSPWLAFTAALPVVLPAPVITGNLMSTLGGNVEPLVYVLLIWVLRERPVACGAAAALGILTREFTAYGVAAVVAIDLLDGRLWSRARWRFYTVAALTASVLFQAVALVRPHLDRLGPGSAELLSARVDPSATTRLAGAFCFEPAQAARNLVDVFGPFLATFVGLGVVPDARPSLGVAAAWPLLPILVGIVLLRLVSRLRAKGLRDVARWPRFPFFLLLVGVQSFAVYAVSRCGPLSTLTLRYALLGVFAFVGLASLHFALERRREWRLALAAVCIALAAVAAIDQVRVARYYVSEYPVGDHRILADYLLARGVRHIRAPYWVVYHVVFLSGERIVGTPSDWVGRILDYERQVEARPGEVVEVSGQPCEGGEQVARWYVCGTR